MPPPGTPTDFSAPLLPAGASAVTYRVTAVRSTKRGEAAPFTVYFGVGGAGEMTVSVEKPPRIAA